MRRLLLVLVLALVPALASAQSPNPYSAPPSQALAPPIVVFPGSANQVSAIAGTASVPSINFAGAGDPSTGFRWSGAGTVTFDSQGSDALALGGAGVGLTIHANLPLQWGSSALSSPDTSLTRGGAAGKLTLTGTTPMLQLGGTTSSFAAIKQVGATLQVRLADDSTSAPISASSFQLAANNVMFATAPTISSGFGTSPAILSSNGTSSFRVNVGTGGVATSGVVAMTSTAANGWNCQVTDLTNNTVTRETASTTTTVTVTAAAAWAASDTLIFNCAAY